MTGKEKKHMFMPKLYNATTTNQKGKPDFNQPPPHFAKIFNGPDNLLHMVPILFFLSRNA